MSVHYAHRQCHRRASSLMCVFTKLFSHVIINACACVSEPEWIDPLSSLSLSLLMSLLLLASVYLFKQFLFFLNWMGTHSKRLLRNFTHTFSHSLSHRAMCVHFGNNLTTSTCWVEHLTSTVHFYARSFIKVRHTYNCIKTLNLKL